MMMVIWSAGKTRGGAGDGVELSASENITKTRDCWTALRRLRLSSDNTHGIIWSRLAASRADAVLVWPFEWPTHMKIPRTAPDPGVRLFVLGGTTPPWTQLRFCSCESGVGLSIHGSQSNWWWCEQLESLLFSFPSDPSFPLSSLSHPCPTNLLFRTR